MFQNRKKPAMSGHDCLDNYCLRVTARSDVGDPLFEVNNHKLEVLDMWRFLFGIRLEWKQGSFPTIPMSHTEKKVQLIFICCPQKGFTGELSAPRADVSECIWSQITSSGEKQPNISTDWHFEKCAESLSGEVQCHSHICPLNIFKCAS